MVETLTRPVATQTRDMQSGIEGLPAVNGRAAVTTQENSVLSAATPLEALRYDYSRPSENAFTGDTFNVQKKLHTDSVLMNALGLERWTEVKSE